MRKLVESWDNSRLEILKNYYDGKHDILRRELEESKPNNKLIHNYGSYIVDILQGYFIGNPVVYSGDEGLLEELKAINEYNDEQDHNSDLARDMGIFGTAVEILYTDENAEPRIAREDPRNMRLIYSNTLNPTLEFALRRYMMNEKEIVEVYSRDEIVTYEAKSMSEIQRVQHFWQDVPIVEYFNNTDRRGDFEGVISLIDAYDTNRSNKTNDLDYFTDAYLCLTGMLGTQKEDVENMRKDRILLLDEKGQAEYLIKPSNVEDSREQIERLNNDIHKFAKVVDMSDENFVGNASGVAMAYKLFAMKQVVANKERKFKKGLQRRIELICNQLSNVGKNYNYLDISIHFDRNEPINEIEKIQGATMLMGIASHETALTYLPSNIISDVKEELERIEGDKMAYVDLEGEDDKEELSNSLQES